MVNTIQERTLSELLGLNSEESRQAEEEMVEVVIGLAIDRLLASLPEESRAMLSESLEGEDYDVDAILEKYPDLLNYIAQESYIYKKNALIEQATSLRDAIASLSIPEESKTVILGNIDKVLLGINDDSNEAQFDEAMRLLENIKSALAS